MATTERTQFFELRRDGNSWGTDGVEGFIVEALDEEDARKIASTRNGSEGEDFWTDPKRSTCAPLKLTGATRVVLRDNRTG